MLDAGILRMAPVVAGVKMLIMATSPLQGLLDSPGLTHEYCNAQAVNILRYDGYEQYANILQRHLKQLNAGVFWADRGWKNVSHYLVADTRKGLWEFSNAITEFRTFYARALKHAKAGDLAQGMFFLGAAAHLVQDMCVPHHARGKLFQGHREFESWAETYRYQFRADGNAEYQPDMPVQQWLLNNATVAADWINRTTERSPESHFRDATQCLLPLAQRSTAGFFHSFLMQTHYDIRIHNRACDRLMVIGRNDVFEKSFPAF
jgi:phospholipase C